MNDIKELFDKLMSGDSTCINSDNVIKLNEEAMRIFDLRDTQLSPQDIEELKQIIMICNVLYNRTDLTVQPIEDGFYDLLLEMYKQYDSNFQVGSAVVQFGNFSKNDLDRLEDESKRCPIIFFDNPKRDEIHEHIYHSLNPAITVNRLDFVESNNTDTGKNISKRTHNTAHNHPDLVGTLDKCKFVYNQDAIEAGAFDDPTVKILERDFFQNHIEKGIISPNQKIGIVCELKYDGISVEADCTDTVLSARTRGDTGIGEASDITPILKGYHFKHAGALRKEKPIGVKFEAIMTKSNLYRFNQARDRTYVNCRSAIVGLFGASDAYLYRDMITLVPLAIDRQDVPYINNRMEEILFINNLFRSHGEPLRYCYFDGTVAELLYLIKAFYDEALLAREYMDFMFDGIVISYTDESIRKKLGRQNYINKYSMAVKFTPEVKQSVFLGYTYEVGQHGNITPMIHYNPVEFFGTIHTKSTGSSLKRFNELALKIGDFINVTYRNDVMPYVSRVECQHNRDNPRPLEKIIDHCPICKSKLVIGDSGKTLYCPNWECPGRTKQRIVNMFWKMNIKGFGEAAVDALGISHLFEIENMSEEWLIETLGQADGKSFYSIIQAILNDQWFDYIIMGALGFTSIARKKWQNILQTISLKDLNDMYLMSKSEEEFASRLASLNITKSAVIAIAHEYPFFSKDIDFILRRVHLKKLVLDDNTIIIRFSGVRNQQLCELLNSIGNFDANDDASVTKKTNILLVPYAGFTSNKVTNATKYGAKIIPINEFMKNSKDIIGITLNEF